MFLQPCAAPSTHEFFFLAAAGAWRRPPSTSAPSTMLRIRARPRAESGVARGVDDVDAVVFPLRRRRLGRRMVNAALALQIVGIHRALDLELVVAVDARLLQTGGRPALVLDHGRRGPLMAIVAKIHVLLIKVADKWLERDLAGKTRDPLRLAPQKPGIAGGWRPKRKAPAKGPGNTLDSLRRNIFRNRQTNPMGCAWIPPVRREICWREVTRNWGGFCRILPSKRTNWAVVRFVVRLRKIDSNIAANQGNFTRR